MKYKTRGNASPQGKARIYFTGHPTDVKQYFESISDDILKLHNCAVFYDEDPEHPEDADNFISRLDSMQLIVLAVTGRYIYGETFAHNTVFKHAMERHIPVLPILEENGIERDFDKKCGNLQYLDPNAKDDTAVSFEEKLKKFLDSVLVGDELVAKVRAAFDAYIFLSYRKKDRRYAQQLMNLIHQNSFCRDIAIWYDEFLVPGEDFNDAILKAMEKSELFALVVTPNLLEEKNYILEKEYPEAQKAGKTILPAVLVPTDGGELAEKYTNIPTPIDPKKKGALSDALRGALASVITPSSNDDPQHIFFIGLAYLSGIDVEVNYGLAVQLITRAAEAGLPEAIEKLASMYRNGEGVERDYRTAIRWQEKLAKVYRAAYEATPAEEMGRQWCNALWDLGNFWYELRQLTEADKAYTALLEAVRLLDAAYHSDWTQRYLSVSYDKLGNICQAQGDLTEAKAFYGKGFAIAEQLATETGTVEALRDLSLSCNRLGDICQMQRDLEGAKKYYAKSLALRERLVTETGTVESRRDLSTSIEKLGNIDYALDDLTGAKDFYKKCLVIREQLAKEVGTVEARRDLSISFEKLGNISYWQGKLSEAKSFYEKLCAIAEQLAAETETPMSLRDLSVSYNNLGNISYAIGDLTGAKDFYKKYLSISEQLAAETGTVEARRDLSVGYGKLGDICQLQGDLTGAKNFYEKLHAIAGQLASETRTVESVRDWSVSFEKLGHIGYARGNLDEAKAFYKICHDIREHLAAEVKTIEAYDDLAVSYWNMFKVAGTEDERQKYLRNAEMILAQLTAKCPNMQMYAERLAIVRQHIK
ncbi:MAG: TIR domain-containing protein [Oscillospiraceae bacterium]|nr:TIR domain-containing protein [Oscillospiraceae bacterium]